jgi:hypothetical protein
MPLMSGDRIHLDAGRLHVDQELRQAVARFSFVGSEVRKRPDHVVGVVRASRPDLRAVEEEPALRRRRLRARREEVRSRTRLDSWPMQKQHSPRVIAGTMSDLMRSFAYLSRIGPLWRSAVKCTPTGAFTTRHSSVTT